MLQERFGNARQNGAIRTRGLGVLEYWKSKYEKNSRKLCHLGNLGCSHLRMNRFACYETEDTVSQLTENHGRKIRLPRKRGICG
jgi:hypothetical protein